MDQCISNHSRCKQKVSKTTFIPRRLLDLGNCGTTSVRLMECGQDVSGRYPETLLQYATLSYCWGNSLTMTTTKANKYKHETTGINVHSMPSTFQDAICVAKKLGIRYLWIDALCIVQDDNDDWEAESVAMCDVFANSEVTICAAKSSSPMENFLLRPADKLLTLRFQSTLRSNICGQYFIRLEPRDADPASHDLDKCAWVSRAWVWQEEVMSSRQIVFGNKTLQFRCREGTLVEDGRCHLHLYALDVSFSTVLDWIQAMATYSRRTLTYASDRLKAVAGVAKFFGNCSSDAGKPTGYLAGIWRNHDIGVQLCWVCMKASMSHTELLGLVRDERQYIAPSWSWASRNTSITYIFGDGPNAFRVIKSDLRASNKSAMVSVAFRSSISLSGKFRQTPVEPSSGRLMTHPFLWPPRWEASSNYGRTFFWLDWVPKAQDAKESTFQRQLYLLLTRVFDKWESKAAAGLVITPAIDPDTGSMFYYRVGVFEHEGHIQMLTNEPERELTIR